MRGDYWNKLMHTMFMLHSYVVTVAPYSLASWQHNCPIASRTTSDGHCSDKIEAEYHGNTLITTKASPVDKPWPNQLHSFGSLISHSAASYP